MSQVIGGGENNNRNICIPGSEDFRELHSLLVVGGLSTVVRREPNWKEECSELVRRNDWRAVPTKAGLVWPS